MAKTINITTVGLGTQVSQSTMQSTVISALNAVSKTVIRRKFNSINTLVVPYVKRNTNDSTSSYIAGHLFPAFVKQMQANLPAGYHLNYELPKTSQQYDSITIGPLVIRAMVFDDAKIRKMFTSARSNEMNLVNAVNSFVEFCVISGIGAQAVEIRFACQDSDIVVPNIIGARDFTKDVRDSSGLVLKTDVGLIRAPSNPASFNLKNIDNLTNRNQMFRISLKKRAFRSWESADNFYNAKMLAALGWLHDQRNSENQLKSLVTFLPGGKISLAQPVYIKAHPREAEEVMFGKDITTPGDSIILTAEIDRADSITYEANKDRVRLTFKCEKAIYGGALPSTTWENYPVFQIRNAHSRKYGVRVEAIPRKGKSGITLESDKPADRLDNRPVQDFKFKLV